MKINVADRRSASAPAAPAVRPSGLFEMTLEVSDLAASERFYHDVIGLWPPETGGVAAIHGGRGGRHVHFALRVPMGTLDTVRARLEALGYPAESRDFGVGNRAIYLDDPDGNVLELTERTTLWDASVATECA